MPETPPIPPALSESDSRELAEDTAIRACRDIYGTLVEDMNGELWAFTPSPEGFHRVMAVANFALPDGDPRKVTREDVAAVLDAWEHSSGNEDDDSTLRRLAMKLAAILPPEGEPDAE